MSRITTLWPTAVLLLGACSSNPTDADTPVDEPEQAAQIFDACEDFTITVTEPSPDRPWTPNAIELVAESVGDGVYAIYDTNAETHEAAGLPLATSGGFVIGEDGVLLVETMVNQQLFCQVIDLVQDVTDKPVLYAINTSYHGDHSYGNAYLPEDVRVVQHARTADYIAANFESDVTFMESALGADQGLDDITPVSPDIEVTDAGWSVDLGGITVEARYFGFGQTDGDLFIYVPEANVLWTGNPLIAAAPAIPWLLDGHAHEIGPTLAEVQAFLPPGAVVIPGHGAPTSAATFDFSIDYMNALIGDVEDAVQAGLTVEQTQAAVNLEAFQGYALWDWVHGVINVPTTWSEIMAP